MEWHEFGAKVRKRREELNISQQDLANALRIDQAKVSLIEKGARKVDLVKEMPALTKVLRCTLNTFLQEDEVIVDDNDPVRKLMNQYFPDVAFSEFEMKRISTFLEPVLQSYVKTNSDLEKKVTTQ